MFRRTTAISKILRMKARKKVIQGGTSAGKTFGILPVLIDKAAKYAGKEISVVSESIPHLRRGAMKDFIKIMRETNRFNDSRWNRSHLKYEFANGSYIEFFSADQPDKLRGARRDILYVNEANNVDWESYHQLAVRTREDIYIDFNPTSSFWAHTEVLKEDDSELLVLTYKDNEALEQTIVNEIEIAKEKAKTSDYWANWWKVYGLGEIGSLQGVVFDNWGQVDKIPDGAKLISAGLDFGYTNDPTSCVLCYQYNGEYYFDCVLYRKGMSNRELSLELKNVKCLIYADSAEPKSINELRTYGLNVTSVKKGADSIRNGISHLQYQRFYVTASSIDLIKELRAYIWKTDKSGASLNEPIDSYNHAIDAMRYSISEKIINSTTKLSFSRYS